MDLSDHYLVHFIVQEFTPCPQSLPVWTREGQWRPPTDSGDNVLLVNQVHDARTIGVHNYRTFSFDLRTRRLVSVAVSRTDLRRLTLQRITSLYYCQGTIFTVNGSVINRDVGTEDHNATNPWRRLSFEYRERGQSHVLYNAPHDRLRAVHHGRTNSRAVFPDGFHPQGPVALLERYPLDWAAVSGDFSSVIALVALSADRNGRSVYDRLWQTFNGGYSHGYTVPMDPYRHTPSGWQDRRGILVQVYTRDGRTAANALNAFEHQPLLR